MIYVLIILFIFLLAFGCPIFFCMGISSLIFLIFQGNAMINIPQQIFSGLDSFPLLAIPLFLLAGKVMNLGGITDRIFRLASTIVGHFRGGLGHVNVLASLIFSGMSGSAIADAGGLGLMEIKAMRERKYPDSFSGGITAASCIIGPLVPPSIPMVVYGVMASTSVGALFLAGFIPGILLALALMAMVALISQRRGYPKEKKAKFSEFLIAFRDAFFGLMVPFIIIGGILGGVFTPTEAAGVASFYAIIIGVFVYRELDLQGIMTAFRETAISASVICIIMALANLFSWVLLREQIPQKVTQALCSISTNPIVILLIIDALIIFMGCFLEGMSIIVITVPVLLPLINELGIDLVHFGVLIVLLTTFGLVTPPMGIALFTISDVAKIPYVEMVKGTFLFMLPIIVVILLLTFFPNLLLFIPKLAGFI